MLEMMILGSVIVFASFFFILWVESVFNSNNEFLEVEEWQDFRSAFDQSNKGEK